MPHPLETRLRSRVWSYPIALFAIAILVPGVVLVLVALRVGGRCPRLAGPAASLRHVRASRSRDICTRPVPRISRRHRTPRVGLCKGGEGVPGFAGCGGSPGLWQLDVINGRQRGDARLLRPDLGPLIARGARVARDGSVLYARSGSSTDVMIASTDPSTGVCSIRSWPQSPGSCGHSKTSSRSRRRPSQRVRSKGSWGYSQVGTGCWTRYVLGGWEEPGTVRRAPAG